MMSTTIPSRVVSSPFNGVLHPSSYSASTLTAYVVSGNRFVRTVVVVGAGTVKINSSPPTATLYWIR